ncbi:adenine nucleotide alpha hydrolase [Consotaella aegiceratis]|uniref:adenine nucleotide alpha hydrolase n=1 Tax=Consotaella aegiceratis TaxID=3097961 RepID=UPI002F4231A4
MTADDVTARLASVLDRHDALAIAVSGGVDSMVLAYVAHRFSRTRMTAFHAVSPAVPAVATARVVSHAQRHGWDLHRLDAGEMSDPDYLANPVNRCFFCKTNLYTRIRAATALPIASGTNMDDLGDFRPGLDAARHHDVHHPYVEAGLAKADIYALAERFGLDDLAALPAQPCLASRIETGIRVTEGSLAFIERMETELGVLMPGASAVRCRLTGQGVHVECDPLPDGDRGVEVAERARIVCGEAGRRFAGLRPYRRGSAFLRDVGT